MSLAELIIVGERAYDAWSVRILVSRRPGRFFVLRTFISEDGNLRDPNFAIAIAESSVPYPIVSGLFVGR